MDESDESKVGKSRLPEWTQRTDEKGTSDWESKGMVDNLLYVR